MSQNAVGCYAERFRGIAVFYNSSDAEIIDTDKLGWPIAFNLPVGNGVICVLPSYCQTDQLVSELQDVADRGGVKTGRDVVEKYFKEMEEPEESKKGGTASKTKPSSFRIVITLDVKDVRSQEKYDNTKKTIPVEVHKQGSEPYPARLTPLRVLQLLYFQYLSREEQNGGLAYKTEGRREIKARYCPDNPFPFPGLEVDVWSDTIPNNLNRIASSLGFESSKGNSELITCFSKDAYKIRSMKDDVTVKCQPDMETVLDEIQGRTSPKYLPPNSSDLIDLLKANAGEQ